jgi:hypothetical protein
LEEDTAGERWLRDRLRRQIKKGEHFEFESVESLDTMQYN